MKTLTDLAKTIGCSEAVLKKALDDMALTANDCYDEPEYMTEVTALVAKASGGLAVASAPTGLAKAEPKARRTTKLKTTSVDTANAQSKGKAGLASVRAADRAEAQADKAAFVESLYNDADEDSEVRAKVQAAYPALVDRMTAEKVAAYRAQMPARPDYAAMSAQNRVENEALLEDFFSIFND